MASNAFKKFKTTSNQHTTQWVKCLQRHCAPQPPDPVSSQNPMGLHVPEGCCWSQDGYLKPRLAGQSALATPHSYYNFPCKAIYVVWQHNSYKQNEYIDSWIVKGSGLIFFFFFKMISLNSSVIPPTSWSQPYHRVQLQHSQIFHKFSPLQTTASCPCLEVPREGVGGTGKILLAHTSTCHHSTPHSTKRCRPPEASIFGHTSSEAVRTLTIHREGIQHGTPHTWRPNCAIPCKCQSSLRKVTEQMTEAEDWEIETYHSQSPLPRRSQAVY